MLRYFHIQNISPSGWIGKRYKPLDNKTTTCTYEYSVEWDHIVPLNDKAMVPYKICSFDIEASSSHGDFPLPVKNYRKLATNIVEYVNNRNGLKSLQLKGLVNIMIMTAFGLSDDMINSIDRVYPKTEIIKKI